MSREVGTWLFDFDGVLVESNDIKEQAFVALYADHARHHDAIRELHRREGALSRDRKIARIQSEILHQPIDEVRCAQLCRCFSALVVERVIACPAVPGACETLRRLHGRVPMYVVSGTPQDELRRIVAARGMDKYFVEVLGAPAPKSSLVESILRRHGYAPDTVVLVGDAELDLQAAQANGIGFVARIGRHSSRCLREWPHRVADLHGVVDCSQRVLETLGPEKIDGCRVQGSRDNVHGRMWK